jgi:hypothetical protein
MTHRYEQLENEQFKACKRCVLQMKLPKDWNRCFISITEVELECFILWELFHTFCDETYNMLGGANCTAVGRILYTKVKIRCCLRLNCALYLYTKCRLIFRIMWQVYLRLLVRNHVRSLL